MSDAQLLSPREACERLLAADSESAVSELLQQPYYADGTWKPLGGVENNYGIVENQQGNSIGAFTEIVVNSLDAILLKRYKEEYGGTEGNAPSFSSMKEAADDLLDDDESEDLVIRADGTADRPNLTVYDSGEGQQPAHFESRFLGFLEPGKLKQEYQFLQGQYGMGSTGVLPFCGDAGYKLIVSADWRAQREWSWTTIRKNRDKNTYEYLTRDGDIPVFDGDLTDREYGTFVKLYSYQLPLTSHIGYGLRQFLDRYLLRTPVAITLEETRESKISEVSSFNTRGMLEILDRNQDLVLDSHIVNYSFDSDTIGDRDVGIVVFKHDDDLTDSQQNRKKNHFTGGKKHRKQALFFTINSQTHGDLGQTFIKNRCSRPRVAKDTLVFVDFTDLGPSDKVDIFPASRDRLRDGAPAEALKEGLEDIITNDEVLEEEEYRRRQRLAKDEEEQTVQHVLEAIIDRNPGLKRYFATGKKVTVPEAGTQEEEDYDPPYFPDSFKIIKRYRHSGEIDLWDESKGTYTKRMPTNRDGLQRFELNAPNDYFDRAEHTGNLQVTPSDILKSRTVHNGVLTLGVEPLPNVRPGQVLPVTVEVTRPGQEPLTQSFEIHFTEPVEEQDEEATSGEQQTSVDSIDLPETHRVWEDDWGEFGFDEHSALQIDIKDDGLEFWINMDCSGLQEFIARNNLRDNGKERVKDIFETGMTLFGLAQYIELNSKYDEEELRHPPDELVATNMRGVAQVLLDHTLSEEDIKDLSY